MSACGPWWGISFQVINFEQIESEKSANSRPETFRFGGIMAVRKSSKYKEYQLYAEHCLKLVRIAASREVRVIQREMAGEWLKLADMFSASEQPAK